MTAPASDPPLPRPGEEISLEQIVHLATLAGEDGMWDLALQWLEIGRARAPTSMRLALDAAYANEKLGETEHALRLYAEASRLGSDEADYLKGLLHARLYQDEDAVDALLRALQQDASLVWEMLDNKDLAHVRNIPRLRMAMTTTAHAERERADAAQKTEERS